MRISSPLVKSENGAGGRKKKRKGPGACQGRGRKCHLRIQTNSCLERVGGGLCRGGRKREVGELAEAKCIFLGAGN